MKEIGRWDSQMAENTTMLFGKAEVEEQTFVKWLCDKSDKDELAKQHIQNEIETHMQICGNEDDLVKLHIPREIDRCVRETHKQQPMSRWSG